MKQSYKSIPVDAARQVADDYEKDIMLLVGWDWATNSTNVVTWGRDPVQKQAAAVAGETIRQALKLDEASAATHEDFRREGEAARVVDELRRRLAAIRELLATIVIAEGEDAGVILLSDQSPSHFDPEAKCQVYDYQNFSPLGDALVALAKLANCKDLTETLGTEK